MSTDADSEARVVLDVRELRAETWNDFERVLGSNGGARGCWCMHWRLSIAEWTEGKGEGNQQAMKELASREQAPGVLAYKGDQPVAWCSLGPRTSFPRLERSSLLASIDDAPVCAITCIFVHRQHRGAGLLAAVLDAVCDYAATLDYTIVEGYPVRAPSWAAGGFRHRDDGHRQRLPRRGLHGSGPAARRPPDHAPLAELSTDRRNHVGGWVA